LLLRATTIATAIVGRAITSDRDKELITKRIKSDNLTGIIKDESNIGKRTIW
jgi:hypothetical protein